MSIKLAFIAIIAALAQLGLAVLASGGFGPFFSHRGTHRACVVVFVLLAASFFSSGNLSSGEREDRANRWVFVAFGRLDRFAGGRASLYRSDRLLDHRRRDDTLDRRRARRDWRRAAPLACLCARPQVQRTCRHSAEPSARNERHLSHHSQPELSRPVDRCCRLGARLPLRWSASSSRF